MSLTEWERAGDDGVMRHVIESGDERRLFYLAMHRGLACRSVAREAERALDHASNLRTADERAGVLEEALDLIRREALEGWEHGRSFFGGPEGMKKRANPPG